MEFGVLFLGRGDEGLGVDVGSEIYDPETRTLEHHSDKVLADVVKVPLHGPDHDRALGLGPGLGEDRPQHLHARLHGVRRHQHLGDEEHAFAELTPDLVHGRDHPLVKDVRRLGPRAQLGLDQLGGSLLVVRDHGLVDVLNTHRRLLFVFHPPAIRGR